MTKLTSAPKPPQRFDLQKFEQMNDPFSIRVDKHRGSLKYEVTPPVPDEAGWTKERVRSLENWLVNEWSGGGHYSFAITDSSAPSQTMEWTSYYPPADFPEKIPPTLQNAASIPAPPAPAQTAQPQPTVNKMASNPMSGALPPASYFQHAPMQQHAQQPSYTPPAPTYFQPPIAPGFSAASAAAAESAELRAAREALAQMREQNAQREFDRRVAELKAEGDRRFQEMQQSMQAMVQQLAQAIQQNQQTQKPAVDPMIEQLREQNRRLEEQMRLAQTESERARREQELREQIRTGQEETRRLVEEANRRYEAMMREAGNKGPDPQFLMMMEMTKEIARSSQSQMERLQAMMMRPQDIMQMAKESSSSADQIASQVGRTYQDIVQLQRSLIEQAAQLNQGGESPVLGLVEKGVDRLSELAARYNSGKSKEAVEQMRAQAEIAKAQAEAMNVAQSRMSDMARMEAAQRQGVAAPMSNGTYAAPGGTEQGAIPASTSGGRPKPPWVTPKAPKPSNGLNGANGSHEGGQVVPIKPNGSNGSNGSSGSRKVKGRTDAEWFGPMLPNVTELRHAVDLFLAGLQKDPPEKAEKSASPEECAYVINQAAMEIAKLQVNIPAMSDLLFEGSVADFLDVLLPDVPQAYRDDVVQILAEGDEDEEIDEDEEEIDEDEDEVGAS